MKPYYVINWELERHFTKIMLHYKTKQKWYYKIWHNITENNKIKQYKRVQKKHQNKIKQNSRKSKKSETFSDTPALYPVRPVASHAVPPGQRSQ